MKNQHSLLVSLFFLIAAVPIFYRLADHPIFIWDEAIYANNALEMALHGDPLVLKNNGEVSLYNTKPPLVIWLQCLGIKILGANEWAIRLPSALAALSTAFLLYLFARRSLGDSRIGLVAVLTLVTSPGYVRNHVARSGDLDSVLTFWIAFYALLAFHYLLYQPEHYKKYFNWIGLGVLLAFLSKSVAGLMPLPGLALAAMTQRQLIPTLRKKHLYVVALVVVLLCLGYYGIRESLAPGYLQKVIDSEYLRFTENIMPWHEQSFWFYLVNMWKQQYFMPYLVLLPLAILAGYFGKEQIRRVTVMTVVFCLSYFLLISFPSVKLNYYDAPLYPFLSLLIGMGLVSALDRTREYWRLNGFWKNGLFAALLVLLFALPYQRVIKKISDVPLNRLEREGYAIRHLAKTQPEWKHYWVLMKTEHEEHLDQANFYIKSINHFQGKKIGLIPEWKDLQPADRVLCCQQNGLDSLAAKFQIRELAKIGNCQFLDLQYK